MKKISFLLGLVVLLSCFSGIVQASTDIMGMGNAPGPATPGDNGIEWNPAAMSPGNVFVLDLALLNTSIRTDALSIMDILEYGGLVEGSDSVLTEEEIDDILKTIPKDGYSIYLNHVTRPKLIIGPIGLSVGIQAYSRGTLDKDLFTLLLKGNAQYVDIEGDSQSSPDPDKLFSLTDTQADVLVTGDAAVSVSFPISNISFLKQYFDEFYVGGSYHLIGGGYGNVSLTDDTSFYIGYGEPDENNVQIVNIRFADNKTYEQKLNEMEVGEMFPIIRGIYTLDPENPTDTSYIGMGSAVDLGVYATKGPFTFGLSAMNNGSLRFNNYQIIEYGPVKNDTEGFSMPEEPVIRTGTNPIKVPLPSKINAGVSYHLGHWLLVGLQLSTIKSVSVNLDENEEMISTTRNNYELGIGVEVNPIWVLPLRAGIVKTRNSLIYTGGFGLHLGPLQTDIGVAANYKSASVGVNVSLEF